VIFGQRIEKQKKSAIFKNREKQNNNVSPPQATAETYRAQGKFISECAQNDEAIHNAQKRGKKNKTIPQCIVAFSNEK
jgi:hypothetical protein